MVDSATSWWARAGKIVVAALLVIVTVVPGASPAQACSCGYDPQSLADVFARSDITAFVGKAVSVTEPTDPAGGGQVYTFEVEQSLKGYAGPTIEVKAASGPLCGGSYPLNVPLGVTLYGTDKDRFSSSLCNQYSYTYGVDAFLTWFSGTLPAPTGSGPIAGFGYLGSDTWGVVDDQLRLLGYIPIRGAYLESCPGDRYLAGWEELKNDAPVEFPNVRAVSVDLTTLAITHLSKPDNVISVDCLDTNGTMLVTTTGGQVEIVSRTGERRAVATVTGSVESPAPTVSGKQLVWVTTDEMVITDLSGAVVRRLPITAFTGGGQVIDDLLLTFTDAGTTYTATDVSTGAATSVPLATPRQLDWEYSNRKLFKLTGIDQVEVVELPSGTRSQLTITNGPTDDGWELRAAPDGALTLTKTDATVFYVLDAAGAATSYPNVGNGDASATWSGNSRLVNAPGRLLLTSPSGAQRVLNNYDAIISRIDGPTLNANACGITAIPTVGYKCDPPTLPPTF